MLPHTDTSAAAAWHPLRSPSVSGPVRALAQHIRGHAHKLTLKDAVLRTLPIWLTVVLLLVTRIPQLKLKGILQRC